MSTSEHESGNQLVANVSASSTEDDSQQVEEELAKAAAWTRTSKEGREPRRPAPLSVPDKAQVEAWHRLLDHVATDIAARGGKLTAAGVSLGMRGIDPSFTPQAAGYHSFKSFLEGAARAGVVSLTQAGVQGNADILVAPKGKPGTAEAGIEAEIRWIRVDLWRAVFDTQVEKQYVYDRRTRSTFSTSVPPDQPLPGDHVSVPRVTKSERLEWMREFAQASAEPLKDRLLAALRDSNAVETFDRCLSGHSRAAVRAWSRTLRVRAIALVNVWADEHQIPREHLYQTPAPSQSRTRSASSNIEPRDAASQQPAMLLGIEDVRSQLISAIQKMPMHQLLRLEIPVEYVLR